MKKKVFVTYALIMVTLSLFACGKKAEIETDSIQNSVDTVVSESVETSQAISVMDEAANDTVKDNSSVSEPSEDVPLTALIYDPDNADVYCKLERIPKGSVAIYLEGTDYLLLYADLGDGLSARVCNSVNGDVLDTIPYEMSDTELVFYADMSKYENFSFDAVSSYAEIINYDGDGGAYITYAASDVAKYVKRDDIEDNASDAEDSNLYKDEDVVSNAKYLNAKYVAGSGENTLLIVAVDEQDVPTTILFSGKSVKATDYEVIINDSAILQVGYYWDDGSWTELNYLKDEDMFILKNNYGGEYLPTGESSSNENDVSEKEVDKSFLAGYVGKYTDSLGNCFELTQDSEYEIKNLKLYSVSGWPETVGVDGDRFYDTPTISCVKQGKDYIVVETISQYILAEGCFKFYADGTVEVSYSGGVLSETYEGRFFR